MKILITTFGSLGDLFPYLNIARLLVESGHSITIVTNEPHRERVEAVGHKFHPLLPNINRDPDFFRRVMDEFRGGRYLLEEILFPYVRDNYRELIGILPGHDLLITHMATPAGPLVARTTGIPWISTVLAPISMFSDKDPPVLNVLLRKLRTWSPGLTAFVNRQAKGTAIRWSRPVVQFQKELGQSEAGNALFEGQHSPQKVLALFSRHMAPVQEDWPKQTVVTGFPLLPPLPLPENLERFLAGGEPPVVITLGSTAVFTPGSFFEFARHVGRRVLLLAGPSAASIPATKDVLAVEYAPHSAVFPHASVIIHQGGIGTTAEALRSGRPSLVVPFCHDQPDNAYRLERLGVGRTLSRRSLSVKTLRREVEELIANPGYANAARELGTKIAAEDGPLAAAREIAG